MCKPWNYTLSSLTSSTPCLMVLLRRCLSIQKNCIELSIPHSSRVVFFIANARTHTWKIWTLWMEQVLCCVTSAGLYLFYLRGTFLWAFESFQRPSLPYRPKKSKHCWSSSLMVHYWVESFLRLHCGWSFVYILRSSIWPW